MRLYSTIPYCFQMSIRVKILEFYNGFICELLLSLIELTLNSYIAQSIITVSATQVLVVRSLLVVI